MTLDEKLFTVQTPTNTQNDAQFRQNGYTQGQKALLSQCHVSVAVSKRGKTSLEVLVDPGAKVNSTCTTVTTCWEVTAYYETFVDCRPTVSSFSKMPHQHIIIIIIIIIINEYD